MIDPELSQEITRFFRQMNEERAQLKPPPGKLATILNSPFTVTVLGGLFLSILSLSLQERAAGERERNERYAMLQDKKHAMMAEFAHRMTLYLQCAPDVRLRGLFFIKNKNNPEKEKLAFRDGRNWSQTLEKYEQSLAHLNTLDNPDTLCAKAAAIFESSELTRELAELDALMDKYIETTDPGEYSKLCDEAPDKLQAVISLMGKELRSSNSK